MCLGGQLLYDVTFNSIRVKENRHLIHKEHDGKSKAGGCTLWGDEKDRFKGCKVNSKVAPIIYITNG